LTLQFQPHLFRPLHKLWKPDCCNSLKPINEDHGDPRQTAKADPTDRRRIDPDATTLSAEVGPDIGMATEVHERIDVDGVDTTMAGGIR